MTTHSVQKIIAFCDFTKQTEEVLAHGLRLATVFGKELCITAIRKSKAEKERLQVELAKLSSRLSSEYNGLKISYLLLSAPFLRNMDELVDTYNAVLAVFHQTDAKWAFKAFRMSRIAFLFVNGVLPRFLNYKNVLLPVEFRKASRESALWASYFARFNYSKICLVLARETDDERVGMLKRNLKFLEKFFFSQNIGYELISGNATSWSICSEALARVDELGGDLVAFAGSGSLSLLDWLVGLPEAKIVSKAGNLPVLLINPKKDICTLCD